MSIFDKPESRLNTSSTKWDRYQSRYQLTDVIPLWVADMDFECPHEVKEALLQRAQHGIYGYTDPTEGCQNAIVEWEKRHHQLSITKDDIVFTTGVVYAISNAVEMLVKPDEKVMALPPVYPPFFNIPTGMNREVVYVPLLLDQGGKMDLKQIEKCFQEDDSIRMLIFCNPHNPIGKSWTKEELKELLEITHRYNIIVVSDEIHGDLTFKPYHHVSMLNVDSKYNDSIILLAAPTKTFNLAGLKISYAIIPNEEIRTEFARLGKSRGLSSINLFGFEALEAAYTHGDPWLEEMLEYVNENMQWLKSFLNEQLPKCRFEIPQSTYLAWVDFSGYDIPENFTEILKFEGGVELQDGRGFKGSEGYQRINCACPRATLQKGMERVVSCMKKKKWL